MSASHSGRAVFATERHNYMIAAAATGQTFQVSITAVIVLYKRLPDQSEALVTLQAAFGAAQALGLRLQILLYDNTPGGQYPGSLPSDVLYHASPRNEGLAAAYNWAIERADENNSDWLLTLDQDTTLPQDFLVRIGTVAHQLAETPAIGAIVPRITGAGKSLSPYRFFCGAIPFWYTAEFNAVSPHPVFAFNSAALIRISTLHQVGGYSPWFWLDNSDVFLFRQMHRFGKQVFVLGELQVDHEFSMLDIKNRVSPERYHNVLLTESAFWDLEMSIAAGLERTARLIIRLVKQTVRKDPPELRRITLSFLQRRLFSSKTQRIQDWERQTSVLFPGLPTLAEGRLSSAPSASRPKISVCMAAYNGAYYIERQIQSILVQLGPDDEIVVIDDASTDSTVQVIRSMQAPAIRLICHHTNQGVRATFEEALRSATGQIIFLADDDDLWAPDKVVLFMEAFAQNPAATLVTSRVAFIDQHDRFVDNDMYKNRKFFQAGFWANLLRNHFQGSAMAFRATLLESVLPLPKDVGFMHDHWIGTRNARLGYSAIYLEKDLLFYRRHGRNLSRYMSRTSQVKVRLQFLWAHFCAALRDLV